MHEQHTAKQSTRKEVSEFLRGGIDHEGRILESGITIRERSKAQYKQEWLDARLQLLSISALLLNQKDGVPGETSAKISDRLTLIMAFLQGVYATETLISEGQYIKAAAALKQDIEILARIGEIKHEAYRITLNPLPCAGYLNDLTHRSEGLPCTRSLP